MNITHVIAASVAAGLLLSACGSGPGEDTSAVAAGGDDAGADIEDTGDDRPATEDDPATVVLVTVDVPADVQLAGTAVVALEDITHADRPSVEIASVELPAAELQARDDRVELFLPLPLDGSIDVTATVHIDVDENGSVSQGDWISPDLAMVTAGASEVTVTIVPV